MSCPSSSVETRFLKGLFKYFHNVTVRDNTFSDFTFFKFFFTVTQVSLPELN